MEHSRDKEPGSNAVTETAGNSNRRNVRCDPSYSFRGGTDRCIRNEARKTFKRNPKEKFELQIREAKTGQARRFERACERWPLPNYIAACIAPLILDTRMSSADTYSGTSSGGKNEMSYVFSFCWLHARPRQSCSLSTSRMPTIGHRKGRQPGRRRHERRDKR